MDAGVSGPAEPEERDDVGESAHGCEGETPEFVREGGLRRCVFFGQPEEVFVPGDHHEAGDAGAETHWDECQAGNARCEAVDPCVLIVSSWFIQIDY